MRVRGLAPRREPERPVLEGLAVALLDGRAHEALGYRSLCDNAREQLAWGPGACVNGRGYGGASASFRCYAGRCSPARSAGACRAA
jgi:hypothetical protein